MPSHYVVPSQALPKQGGNYSMTASGIQEPQELPPSCLHQLQELVFIPVVTEVLSQTRASLQPPVQTSQDHVTPGGLTVPELTCFPLLWYNKLKRSGVCLSSVHSTPRQSLEQQETVKNHLICTFKWKINK